MIHFEVTCETSFGQMVGVCGNGPLGDWDISRCLVLQPTQYPVWSGQVRACAGPLEFKYVLVSTGHGGSDPPSLISWEGSFPNRRLDAEKDGAARLMLVDVFGEPDRSSLEAIVEPAVASGEGQGAEACSSMPLADSEAGGGRPRGDSVLDGLNVDPSVRALRLVRSESGEAFAAKYEARESFVLGTGMSGGVCVAVQRSSGSEVAVKTLCTAGLSPERHKQTLAEVQNQLSMDHPNICRLLEVFEEPGQLRLVMERMKGPDLYEHWSSRGAYFEKDAASCVRQMCSAVGYCHRNGVCHRDLKLENFCLEDTSDEARVKMIDFGLSEALTTRHMSNAVGTLYYMAPEVLRGRYTEKCDMWSLGVLTYILLDGRPPFQGSDDRATFKRIRNGLYSFPETRWARISHTARRFVAALLEIDTRRRLSAEEAMDHAWLKTDWARESDEAASPLDAEVLEGMRAFVRSNCLKRAVLSAVAPVATVEKVSHWASQFEELDARGEGTVSVQNLIACLVKNSAATEEEASAIGESLAGIDDKEELVSYTAFLAACLSAKMTLTEEDMAELFNRLDQDHDGLVSTEDLRGVLGHLVDPEALEAELAGELGDRKLEYADFRWLLLMPRLGPTVAGLRQLMTAYSDKDRRADSARLRMGLASEEEQLAAARRENMSWRLFWRERTGSCHGSQASSPERAGSRAPSAACSRSPSDELSGSPRQVPSEGCELLLKGLEADDDSLGAKWAVATAEAKEGDVDAARLENLAWRKMHKDLHSDPRADSKSASET